jgi:hypothetical protein
MLELDETTRRALSQRYGPTAAAQARVLAQLRGTLGGPLGPDGGGGETGPPASVPTGGADAVWIAKICAATTGLTGAGLLVLKLGASVVMNGDAPEPATAPVAASTDNVEVPASAPITAPTPEIPELQIDAPTSTDSPVAAPPPAKVVRPTSTPGSTLAAELALLDAAERIRSRDPEAALVRLEQHRREFPTGALAPEREVMHVEVSCALGRAPAAKCVGIGSHKRGD